MERGKTAKIFFIENIHAARCHARRNIDRLACMEANLAKKNMKVGTLRVFLIKYIGTLAKVA